MRRVAVRVGAALIVAAGVLVAGLPSPTAAQASCALSPLFSLFRQVVGAELVGDCTESVLLAANGDISQATTNGRLAYRAIDQVVTFTDGQTTWLFGPEGLQSRPSSDRYAWEPTPEQGAGRVARPEPTMPASKLTPELAARCSNLGFDVATEGAPRAGAGALDIGQRMTATCRNIVEVDGEAGFACFEPAARDFWRSVSRAPSADPQVILNAFIERVQLCLNGLPR